MHSQVNQLIGMYITVDIRPPGHPSSLQHDGVHPVSLDDMAPARPAV